jgi:hypothetical protein
VILDIDHHKPPNKTERSILFSAPCLDPEIRGQLALAAEEKLAASVESVVKIKPAKVEKGFLFSAPSLGWSVMDSSRPSKSERVEVEQTSSIKCDKREEETETETETKMRNRIFE